MRYDVLDRFTKAVKFTAEIECESTANESWKLRLAILWGIKQGANMFGANMSGANMSWADMSGANMSRANMSGANMSGANMFGANMSWADMSWADMSGANMSGANMSGANMSRANMSGANMFGANMSWADMSWADMSGAKGLDKQPSQTIILPEGDLIVYKKLQHGVAKLLIPKEAKRSNAAGRKCRAEYAKVLEMPSGYSIDYSQHDKEFKYQQGEIVKCHEWSDKWYEECAGGIHFFLTKEEAENY